MDELPKVEDLLAEVQNAFVKNYNSTVAWRDRYGYEVYKEALRTATILALLRWATDNGNTEDMHNMIKQLITAIYRSA